MPDQLSPHFHTIFVTYQYIGVFLLSPHRARQRYRIQSLHLPGLPAKAAVLGTAVTTTHCIIHTSIYAQAFQVRCPIRFPDLNFVLLCMYFSHHISCCMPRLLPAPFFEISKDISLKYKPWSSSLCNFTRATVTFFFFFFGPNAICLLSPDVKEPYPTEKFSRTLRPQQAFSLPHPRRQEE